MVPVLKTQAEIERDTERILNGEEPLTERENTVAKMPQEMKTWLSENQERIENAATLPYWMQDNGAIGEDGKYSLKPIAKHKQANTKRIYDENGTQQTIGNNASILIKKVFSDIELFGHSKDASPIFWGL